MTKRERLYPEIKRLREVDGLKWREIGARFGLSAQTANQYYSDPDGSAARARKAKTNGRCVDCGAATCSDGSTVPERCTTCRWEHDRALTRQWILDSFVEWHRLFGAPPTPHDWNFSLSRLRTKRPDDHFGRTLARYESTGRPWPANRSVYNHFKSWPAALRVAGLEPLAPNERWVGHRGIAARDEDRAAA